jgi:lipopolysaccharide transport system ATP-binding protein
MFLRLAFAVNIACEPEIMIVDEALAVGDMNFQAKCMTALTRIQKRGATVLFVSHDIGALKSLCSRGIYLERGAVKASGKAADIAEQYLRTMREEMNAETQRSAHAPAALPGATKTDSPNGRPIAGCDATLKRSDAFEKGPLRSDMAPAGRGSLILNYSI